MNLARLLMIDLSSTKITPDERAFLRERQPGGVCLFGRNVVDRWQVANLVTELRSLAGPDLIVAVDQEGGGVIRITDLPYPPGAMALGAADDPRLTRDVAAATGRGLRAVGINVDFAPVADVNSNPANPVIADRSFGADPEQVARHVVAFVEGLQQEGVAATVKHFPGHGDVAIDSHLALPVLESSVEMLERLEWPPFIAALTTGVAAVMTAHILLRSVDAEMPATLSAPIIRGLLRERLGFEGVVFTDSLDMKAVTGRWGAPQATALALAAGVDMATNVAPVREHEAILLELERAIADGRLDPKMVEASVRRLKRLSTDFPPHTDPAAGWRSGDESLLEEAARRALVALGPTPELAPGSKVLVVAAEAVRQTAATQAKVRPVESLLFALHDRGLQVEHLDYAPDSSQSVLERALGMGRSCDLVIFASTARTALDEGEVEMARALAQRCEAFLHIALWNPYAVTRIPGPALVTFGWRERSARAVVGALFGEGASGVAPVPLRTLDLAGE